MGAHFGECEMSGYFTDDFIKHFDFLCAAKIHTGKKFELGHLVATQQIQGMQQETGIGSGDFTQINGNVQITPHQGV